MGSHWYTNVLMQISKGLKVSFDQLKHRKIEDSVCKDVLPATELLKLWYELVNNANQYELRLEKDEIYGLYRSQDRQTRNSLEKMNLDDLVESRLKRRQELRKEQVTPREFDQQHDFDQKSLEKRDFENDFKLQPAPSNEPEIGQQITPEKSSRTVEISQELDKKIDEVLKQSEIINSPKLESSVLSPLKLDTEPADMENFVVTPRETVEPASLPNFQDSPPKHSPSKSSLPVSKYEIAVQTTFNEGFNEKLYQKPTKPEESAVSKIPMLKLPTGFVPKTRLPPMIPFGKRIAAPISEVKPIPRNINRPDILNTQKFLSFGLHNGSRKTSPFLDFNKNFNSPQQSKLSVASPQHSASFVSQKPSFGSPKHSIVLEQQHSRIPPQIPAQIPSQILSQIHSQIPQPKPRTVTSGTSAFLHEITTKDQIQGQMEDYNPELHGLPSDRECNRLVNTHSRSFLAITK